MTDFLASLAVAISESLALSLIGKATIVAAAGLLVARAMRNVRASRKYLVLAWTFVVLAGMPVLALLAGPLTIVVRENTLVTAPAPALTLAAALNGERDLVARVPGGRSMIVPTSGRHTVTAGTLAAAGWAIGIVVCLLPMVRTLRRLRLLRRTARVWSEGGAATILRHEDVTVPMTFGLLQPVVLLPNDISEWSDADVERALTHEIEHVRRRDWPVHLFVRFICALYWFHPVVWRAGRQLYLEADRACDDAVVRRGDGDAFADQLVALAGRLVSRDPAVVPSMAGGDLSTRVLAMVNPRQARGHAGVACRLLASVVAIACGAAIAPLKAVEATRVRAAGSDRLLSPAEPANERSAVDRVVPLVASDIRRAPVAERIASIGASVKGRPQPGAQVPVTDSAQAPARQHADAATFEVVSVKPLPDSTNNSGRYRPEPTRFSGDFSVTDAVAFAYQIQSTRIVGAPPWARTERYEINATTAPRKPGDIQSMMRHLLEERFALKVHRERRATPVYALLMSRPDGGLGPNLQRVQRDCTRRASNLRGCSASFGVDHYRSNGQDWGVFVGSLETRVVVGRPIVDKTGLSGQFDLTLEWNPDITRVPEGVSNAPTLAELEARPALFTAVREQLGLKLESDTVAMDILVIDSVNRATPD